MSEIRLIEIEPGRFVVDKPRLPPARSLLPCPMVISDEMEPVEQVDGRFYTSKRKFRAVGRAHGLIEVGNEKPKPHVRSTDFEITKQRRRAAIKSAVARYKSGQRPRRQND